MTLDLRTNREARHVRELAERYGRAGYDVEGEPAREKHPAFLAEFRPDIVATKGGKGVVIEVKGASKRHGAGELARLAALVQSQPGWEFRLVLADVNDIDWRPQSVLPSVERLRKEQQIAKDLIERGLRHIGYLALWAVFEAAARYHLAEFDVDPTERISPVALLKTLVSEGVVADEQYQEVLRALRSRNEAAHGFLETEIAPESVAVLDRLATDLLRALEQSAA
jgi:REase_AHJR-like